MKRFLSISSLLIGVGIIAYSIYLAVIGNFNTEFMMRNMQFLMAGFVLLGLGILGIVKTRRVRDHGMRDKGVRRTPPTIFVAAGLLLLMLTATVGFNLLTTKISTSRYDRTLRPYMKSQYSETNASLPENPRYILYDRVKDRFQNESRITLKGFETNPEKVNTVVAFREGTQKIGTWENEGGTYVAEGYTEYMMIEVIRLSDWALVDQQRFVAERSSSRINKKKDKWTYMITIYDEEIVQYLNGLFGD